MWAISHAIWGKCPTPREGNVSQTPVRTASILPGMKHDAAHKHIYILPEVTADLLRLVLPDWADRLDFETLEDVSSEFFDANHDKRVSDMVWRVQLRGGRKKNGERPSLLILIEFQSEVDWHMARRMREYTDLLLARLVRRDRPQREGGLPWVLPIVVYNGQQALDGARAKLRPGAPALGGDGAGAGAAAAAEVRSAVGRCGLDSRGATGGGLASGQSGGGDRSAAAVRLAEGTCAATAGGGGALPRPCERLVPAGAACLGEGTMGR